MKIENYESCDELIKIAKELYEEVKKIELNKDDRLYVETYYKYINTYNKFKKKQIESYIDDLKTYLL